MKYLIDNIVNGYADLLKQERIFEKHLEARENADMRDRLTFVKMRIGAIESLFALLSIDEKVVFRQILLGACDPFEANCIATSKWGGVRIVNHQSPWKLKQSAFHKIEFFCFT